VPDNSSDCKARGKEKLNKPKHPRLAHDFNLKEKKSDFSLMEQVTLIKAPWSKLIWERTQPPRMTTYEPTNNNFFLIRTELINNNNQF
jgi:hypothetical protein